MTCKTTCFSFLLHAVEQEQMTACETLPKSAPGVKLTLQTLHVGQKMDDVHVGQVLLESDGSCTTELSLGQSAPD